MKKQKMIITGGAGFIAQELAAYFRSQYEVVLFTRGSRSHEKTNFAPQQLAEASATDGLRYVSWDGATLDPVWTKELEGASLLINLAGATVNCRYNRVNQKKLIESRTISTTVLGKALQEAQNPPRLWINMSSATIYAHSLSTPHDELTGHISQWRKDNMPYSFLDRCRFATRKLWRKLRYGAHHPEVQELEKDLSVRICREWEGAFFSFKLNGIRQVALRTAITFGNGGVMKPYLNLVKYGLGGKQGEGNQWISWIHSKDLARSIEWIAAHQQLEGVINAAAPEAITNAGFMKLLRDLCGQKFGLPAYSWMLEIGTLLLGSETELILKSRWVVPRRLLDSGFRFQYNTMEECLQSILAGTSSQSEKTA
jgi:uncharacterized protein